MRKLYVGLLAIFMFLSAPAVSYASSSQQLLVHTAAKDLPDSAYLKSANQQLHTHTAIEDLGNGFYGHYYSGNPNSPYTCIKDCIKNVYPENCIGFHCSQLYIDCFLPLPQRCFRFMHIRITQFLHF